MSRIKTYLLTLLLLGLLPLMALAQEKQEGEAEMEADTVKKEAVRDSLEVSMLVCAPGERIYELYGHSALRLHNLSSGADVVLNYGVFDFHTPHFAWRFMMGLTDYTVGAVDYREFMAGYAMEGRIVGEQVLNLTQEEAYQLAVLAEKDWLTPGWAYRYNFLYDNCTTRLIRMVEQAVAGKILWPTDGEGERTFRDIIHEYAAPASPWYTLGQDLILGAEMDLPRSVEHQLFSPVYAMHYMSGARIVAADGSVRPLIRQERNCTIGPNAQAERSFPVSPLMAAVGLLCVCLLTSLLEWRRQRTFHLLDDLLLVLLGGLGVVVALLFFLSDHPAVGSNWLILLLHPLWLLYLPWKVVRDVRHRPSHYGVVMGTAVVLAAVAFVCSPQVIPLEVYLLLGALGVRSLRDLSAVASLL